MGLFTDWDSPKYYENQEKLSRHATDAKRRAEFAAKLATNVASGEWVVVGAESDIRALVRSKSNPASQRFVQDGAVLWFYTEQDGMICPINIGKDGWGYPAPENGYDSDKNKSVFIVSGVVYAIKGFDVSNLAAGYHHCRERVSLSTGTVVCVSPLGLGANQPCPTAKKTEQLAAMAAANCETEQEVSFNLCEDCLDAYFEEEEDRNKQRWIPTDQRLPSPQQDVIFIVSADAILDGRKLGGRYLGDGTFSVPGQSFEASHWMPMPSGPEIK